MKKAAALPEEPKELTPEEVIANLKEMIAKLEAEILHYKQDPLYSLYYAHARKSNEISVSLNSFVLSLTVENKTFERYRDLVKLQPEQLKVMDALRRDYLRLDENQLKEVEKTGVPLMEQRNKIKK